MYRFWEPVVQPLLARLEPRTLIEIGSDHGPNTRRLLEFCVEKTALLYVIDPLPKYNVNDWLEEFPDNLVFHEAPSLDVLPTLPTVDVVLIDGDHNWHTVINELRLLAQTASKNARSFPLVLLHDVGWPYGRRDLYYEPDRIPPAERQPYEKAGLRLGRSELDPDGGLNRHRFNATHEGGPHNGVRTAIEDFRSEVELDLELVVVPGINELGILFPTDLGTRAPDVVEFIYELRAPALTEMLSVVETARLEWQIESLDLQSVVRRLVKAEARLSSQLAKSTARGESLIQQRADLQQQRVRMREELQQWKGELKRLNRSMEDTREENLALQREAQLLRARLHSSVAEIGILERRYKRLRSRRSVRFALAIAALATPLVKLMRAMGRREFPTTDQPQSPRAEETEIAGPKHSSMPPQDI